MSTIVCLGIDVALAHNVACLLSAEGTALAQPLTVPNNLPGAQQLADWVVQGVSPLREPELRIGMEATSLYWWHLATYLRQEPRLAAWQPTVYLFNPTVVHSFKAALSERQKTDRVDARVIAERLRFGHLPHPFVPNELYLALQRLTRFRHHLTASVVREKGYFLSLLFLKFSEYGHAQPFSDVFGATSQAVLNEFATPDELAAAPLEALVAQLVQHSRNHLTAPEHCAAELQRIAKDSYRPETRLIEPLNLILATSHDTLHTLARQLREVDAAIAREVRHVPNPLQSIPGIGPVLSAGLLAEIQDIQRFANDAALAQYAGLTWRVHASADFTAEETPMTKTGDDYLRYYLVEAANQVRQHLPEYRDFYARKYAESRTHAHRRALVLTARKLVRLLFALLQRNQLYQPQALPPSQEVTDTAAD